MTEVTKTIFIIKLTAGCFHGNIPGLSLHEPYRSCDRLPHRIQNQNADRQGASRSQVWDCLSIESRTASGSEAAESWTNIEVRVEGG